MDILKLKIGNVTYNIKDQVARTGFATAELGTTTDSSVGEGNVSFSKIAFYGDNNKTNELGSIPLNNVVIPTLVSYNLGASSVITPSLSLTGNNNIIASTSINTENGVPTILISSTSDGTTSGTPTSIKLPVGTSGTVALTSDLPNTSNKVGYGTLTNESGISKLKYYPDLLTQTLLFEIPLSAISTNALKANSVYLKQEPSIGGTEVVDGDNTRIYVDGNGYVFLYKTTDSEIKEIVLPVADNDTIALISDLDSLLDSIDDINSVLDLLGEDVTAAIDTFNEVKEFLEDYENSDSLAALLSDISGNFDNYILKTDIADNLTTNDSTKVLSGKQGKALKDSLDSLNNSAVKKISLNGKEFTPTNGTATLPNAVTKIQIHGTDTTLTTTSSTGEGKINLNKFPTKIKFNGTAVSMDTSTESGEGIISLLETDPVFTASPAYGITSPDISNWNNAITDVKFSSSNNVLALLKKVGTGQYTTFVELPTARYISSGADAETLELILAQESTT